MAWAAHVALMEIVMADDKAKPKKGRVSVSVRPHQDQLNEIDSQIAELQAKKKQAAILAAKEVSESAVMPLCQLNDISKYGYEAAKKKYGESWVE